MKTESHSLVPELRAYLRSRRLLFVGPRGKDASPLLDLASSLTVSSLAAPLGRSAEEQCLEDILGCRVNLNRYSLEHDHRLEAGLLRSSLEDAVSKADIIVAYRTSTALSRALFIKDKYEAFLGTDSYQQARLEHKPWVETELRRVGIETLGWKYTDDPKAFWNSAESGQRPMVVRESSSSGGAGTYLVENNFDFESIPLLDDPCSFFSVSPFLSDLKPVNLNLSLLAGGRLQFHPSSLQIIGIPIACLYPLGFCGSDFSAFKTLDDSELDSLEQLAHKVGSWLYGQGYAGAFGLDALVGERGAIFVEINPRFQGSSPISIELDRQLGRLDMLSCHLSAFLGVEIEPDIGLRELTRSQGHCSQIIVYNTQSYSVRRRETLVVPPTSSDLFLRQGVAAEPNAILFSLAFDNPITMNGFQIDQEVEREIHSLLNNFVKKDEMEAVKPAQNLSLQQAAE